MGFNKTANMSFSQYNSQLDAFSSYHKVQEGSHSTLEGPALPALGHALAGSTGTAIANLAIYPLDLVITRLQVQRSLRKSSTTADEGEYKGVLDAFEQIYNKEGGLSAFYGGVLQDTGKSIADSFLFFLFYNYLRTNRLQKKGLNATTLPALDELGVGAFAGALSKLFTTPISNIVTRKQTASMVAARSSSSRAEPTVADIASQIRSEKGLQGFWSGYSASLVLTLNPSITFFLYETFKRTLLPRAKQAGDAVQDAGEKAGQYVVNAREKGGITTERAGVVANNTTEAAKTAEDFSAKEAGNLLGNALEMLGGKIEETGHALKTAEVKQVKKDE